MLRYAEYKLTFTNLNMRTAEDFRRFEEKIFRAIGKAHPSRELPDDLKIERIDTSGTLENPEGPL